MIVDDNPEYCSELKSCFAASAYFTLLAPVTEPHQALETISREAPDIIVMDMIMPELDGMGLLRTMKERRIGQDAMIFATSPFYMDAAIIAQAQELGIVYFFYKPVAALSVFNRILDIVNARMRMFEKRVSVIRESAMDLQCETIIVNYLRLMGVRPHLKGYNFLKAAIRYNVEHYGRMPGVTTEVYPYVAALYDTSANCVERDIRTAIEYAWNNGDIKAQHSLFGYTVNSHKGTPTAKEFIAMLCERTVIRLKQI